MLYKLVLFTLNMLKLIIDAYILLFNITSDVRGMKISRKKSCWPNVGGHVPPGITTPYPVHGSQHESRVRENNNKISRIYIKFSWSLQVT